MTKDNRKAWMKAANMAWTRDGTMTQETARAQAVADGRQGASMRDLRDVAGNIHHGWRAAYLLTLGKSERDCNADDLCALLYAYAWCRAYSRPMMDWFGAGGMVCEGAPEQVQLSLAA